MNRAEFEEYAADPRHTLDQVREMSITLDLEEKANAQQDAEIDAEAAKNVPNWVQRFGYLMVQKYIPLRAPQVQLIRANGEVMDNWFALNYGEPTMALCERCISELLSQNLLQVSKPKKAAKPEEDPYTMPMKKLERKANEQLAAEHVDQPDMWDRNRRASDRESQESSSISGIHTWDGSKRYVDPKDDPNHVDFHRY